MALSPTNATNASCKLARAGSNSDSGVHRVLVVEKNKILGIISTFDIVRHLAEREKGR
jgi:CBS domain-containing protein